MTYIKINKLKGFKDLEQFGLNILQETISNFIGCETEIFTNPAYQLKKYGIDIFANTNRGFYPVDSDFVIIVGRIFEEGELVSTIGMRLLKKGIKNSARFLTILEGALTYTLTHEYKARFKNCKFLLGEELILHTVTNYWSKGGFDVRYLRHLLEYFNRLRTTSFEGEFFSTGVILTKSHFDFNKTIEGRHRFGETFSLKKTISLANTNQIERRIWYLVDGKKSYFIGNKSLVLTQLFVVDPEYQELNYIDSHTLAKSLKGGDLLFKIENEKLMSVINSSNIEISYVENQWKFRDYTYIREIFSSHFGDRMEIVDSLLFYIIYCSKNSISSIIWLPKEIDKIDSLIKKNTKNKFIKSPIPLTKKAFSNHIIRNLSSDGATVIDKDGNLVFFGCIVDLGKIKISGVKGTGESASLALAGNGISIKVSQDGTIKVFEKKNKKPVII